MHSFLQFLRIAAAVVSSLAIVGGLIQFLWYAGKLPSWVFDRVGRVSWGRVRTGIEKIVAEIRSDAWQPEWVVGIGRTGTLTAALIAENMRWIPPEVNMATVNTKHGFLDGSGRRITTDDFLLERLRGKKVLVVDSEMYRGDTVAIVINALTDFGVQEKKVAILFKFEPRGYKASESNPDYVGERLGRRVLMPWLFTSEAGIVAKKVQKYRWDKP